MKTWLPLALALALCAAPAFAAGGVRGIYLYTEHPENATDMQELTQALQVPGIDGVTVLVGWKAIEPQQGKYAWQPGVPGADLLGQLITLVNGAGKSIDLAIRAGQDTPDWLFSAGATPYSFEVAPLEGDVPSGQCNPVKIAAPWDPVFLREWDAMLTTVAQHLHDIGAYNAVTAVRLTGINRTTAELRLPAEILTKPCATNAITTWLQAGYRPSKLLQAWGTVTDSFKRNFPDKTFTLPIIPSASGSTNREYPFPAIDENGCAYQPPWPTGDMSVCIDSATPDQNAPLLALASSKFPHRLTVAYQNLDLRGPAQPYVVQSANTYGTMIAFQTNDYINFQQAACSVVNGNFGGCDAPTYLSLLELGIHPCRTNAALCAGKDYLAEYIEVLPPDAIAFPSAILAAHNELVVGEHRRATHH